MARLARRKNEPPIIWIRQTNDLSISRRGILFEIAVESVWSNINSAPVAAVRYRAAEERSHKRDAMKRLMRKHRHMKLIPTPALHIRTEPDVQSWRWDKL